MVPPVQVYGDESAIQKMVFELIANNDVAGLKALLLQSKVPTELHDENGMTPLQHAAYKGSKDIVQMLLDQGADADAGRHLHGYSALHFAALSGSADVCLRLLDAGARAARTNSVGRTAAQMAAFVGNHKCVAVINNYVPKAEVEYFSAARGQETQPKLPPALAGPLHRLIMQVNLHPVGVLLAVQRAPPLLQHLDACERVLQLMSARHMKRGCETNEVMAFKLHYMACVLGELRRWRQRAAVGGGGGGGAGGAGDAVEGLAKHLLKGAPVERFIRDCVREFPYRESGVFRQMVGALAEAAAAARPGAEAPGVEALAVVAAAVNGQRAFADDAAAACRTCGEASAPKKCSKCRAVQYCDRECQRLHWFLHKKACDRAHGPSPPAYAPNPKASQSSEAK